VKRKKIKKRRNSAKKKERKIEKDEELESATMSCVPTDGSWMVRGGDRVSMWQWNR
jgi:hypothetical protein